MKPASVLRTTSSRHWTSSQMPDENTDTTAILAELDRLNVIREPQTEDEWAVWNRLQELELPD